MVVLSEIKSEIQFKEEVEEFLNNKNKEFFYIVANNKID